LFGSVAGCGLGLMGAHQVDNAAAALMTLQVLNKYFALYIEEEHIREGLSEARWPGRLRK
ncbi:bifunctional folylpolyglutamate synthase/dihydrofolate synthase, partial [Cohnella sp. REN36]|nr:bifunctional folylpolyglutamate synthase/dihydrofolate synthase [Cohnella sp. REN36]